METRNGAQTANGMTDSYVEAGTGLGRQVRAALAHYTRHQVVFNIYAPAPPFRASQVLDDFTIFVRGRKIYEGRAVISSLVNTVAGAACEASLALESWLDTDLDAGRMSRASVGRQFEEFVAQWQNLYLVSQDYKTVVADVQTFLAELRLWLDHVELRIRSLPEKEHAQAELDIAQELRGQVTAALSSLFERFEAVADLIERELQPAHRAFGRRQLHPYLLCAPFIHRTYVKPLGYAGDYEMMNMIVRNGLEGDSLYAKLVNAYLLDQVGPEAVRGRVGLLTDHIVRETGRVSGQGRIANIFCVACGPAWEAVNFLASHPLANQTRFQMLDFDEETLQYTRNKVHETLKKHRVGAEVSFVKNSVQSILRQRGKAAAQPHYDLIYCSGLYDYLSDGVCLSLNSYLYNLLMPGGLLVVGNFAPNIPVRNFIEHFLEWFLIYRDSRQVAALAPRQSAPQDRKVTAEPTGTNIFLEVRKPE